MSGPTGSLLSYLLLFVMYYALAMGTRGGGCEEDSAILVRMARCKKGAARSVRGRRSSAERYLRWRQIAEVREVTLL